jgi:hypothetical protein
VNLTRKKYFAMNLPDAHLPPTLHLKAIDATDMWGFFSDK